MPPFGSAPVAARGSATVRGLRQSTRALVLTRQTSREAHNDADTTLDLPAPGDYEFFSIPAGSRVAVLFALDAGKGVLYALLPEPRRWAVLHSVGASALARWPLTRSAWRCEVAVDGLHSLIVASTEQGLTCLRPDVVSLSFTLTSTGAAPAIGAPVQVGERIWAPLQSSDGGVRFVSVTPTGAAAQVLEWRGAGLGSAGLGLVQAPLTDGRSAIWPTATGQLLLRPQADGVLAATFLPWPADIEPAFQFGSAWLAGDGGLWQLCFDAAQGSYVYLQLGIDRPVRHATTTPRSSSGSLNFRFATRHKSAPWLDPDFGSDAASDAVVWPLLESLAPESQGGSNGAVVVGLKLQARQGLEAVLRSTGRVEVVLVLDDADRQTALHTFKVSAPARMRVFVHDRVLWAYHPEMARLNGWDLQA